MLKNRITLLPFYNNLQQLRKERILFIVNPISGGEDKIRIPTLVDENLDLNLFDAEIVFTEYGGHASTLAQEAIKDGFDIVASVGGDGTINEVASVLVSTEKKMAIIPSGSGNGLARTLNIPLKKSEAIKRINERNFKKIDSAVLNQRHFFNMAGLGFDAHISALFADHPKRGIGGYVSNVLREVKHYKPQEYSIVIDGVSYSREAFMVSIANSSQYGNNTHISPLAEVDDGLLDICIIKPFPLHLFPTLVYKMLNKSVHHSKYLEIIRGREVTIGVGDRTPVHIDGEPLFVSREINISVKHKSLNIII